jgi:hypothetical protein
MSTSSTEFPTPAPRYVLLNQTYEMRAMIRVEPRAKELQFMDSTVGAGATGNIPDTKKQMRKRIAVVLMMFPRVLPRKKEGGLARLP